LIRAMRAKPGVWFANAGQVAAWAAGTSQNTAIHVPR
jgi:hypothetical protein